MSEQENLGSTNENAALITDKGINCDAFHTAGLGCMVHCLMQISVFMAFFDFFHSSLFNLKQYIGHAFTSCMHAFTYTGREKKSNLIIIQNNDSVHKKSDESPALKISKEVCYDTKAVSPTTTHKDAMKEELPNQLHAEKTVVPDLVQHGDGESKIAQDVIMISYSHRDRELAHKIVVHLRDLGLQIWYDRDCMSAECDVVEAMARAVESSSLILVLFSQEYKDGKNTRMESEYAHNKNKKMIYVRAERNYRPDGWLGLLLGAKLYVDLSGKYPFDVKIQELHERILIALDNSNNKHNALMTTPRVSRANSLSGLNQSPKKPLLTDCNNNEPLLQKPIPKEQSIVNFQTWSKEHTVGWLRTHGVKTKFKSDFRGKHLEFLQQMRQESPDNYYQILRESYGMTHVDQVMVFTEAIDSLPPALRSAMKTSTVSFG